MAYDLTQAYLSSDGQSIAAYPLRQSMDISVAIAGGAEAIIRPAGVVAPALENFLALTCHVLSFAITKNQADGLLRVETTVDSGTTWYAVHAFPLTGYSVVDSVSGFDLPFPQVRFVLVNGGVVLSQFTGWLDLRAY